jgi:phosphoenolpyruvate carboxykinase (GTP)
MNSETTAAAAGQRGVLRPDPFAMKPFCGYHIADYFQHWLSFSERAKKGGRGEGEKLLPKIFHVNWFRKDAKGIFLWPGYRENARVLKWIFERTTGTSGGKSKVTPIGYVPESGSLDLTGLKISDDTMDELLRVDKEEWLGEVKRYGEFLQTLGPKLPKGLTNELQDLHKRLEASS